MRPPLIDPKGDLRRMLLVVLAAITGLRRHATLVQIPERTGLDKKTVTDLGGRAGEQLGVIIRNDDRCIQSAPDPWRKTARACAVRTIELGQFNYDCVQQRHDKNFRKGFGRQQRAPPIIMLID